MRSGNCGFLIRPIRPGERWAVLAITLRAFGPIGAFFMAFTPLKDSLVAVAEDGRLIGAVALGFFSIRQERASLISYICVHPGTHGRGVGAALLEAAVAACAERACHQVFAAVDGYNSRSWSMFHSHGFQMLGVTDQIREFRCRWPLLIFRTFHYTDAAHFLLRLRLNADSEPADAPRSGVPSLVLASLALCLVTVIAIVRRDHLVHTPSPELIAISFAVVLAYTALRVAGTASAAAFMRFPLRYRLWESGVGVGLVLAALFGVIYPAAGSYYHSDVRFRYTEARDRMGKLALAATIPTLVALGTVLFGNLPLPGQYTESAVILVGVSLGMFDTLLCFFPFQAMGGGHLRRWNKAVWLACGAVFVLLYLAVVGVIGF